MKLANLLNRFAKRALGAQATPSDSAVLGAMRHDERLWSAGGSAQRERVVSETKRHFLRSLVPGALALALIPRGTSSDGTQTALRSKTSENLPKHSDWCDAQQGTNSYHDDVHADCEGYIEDSHFDMPHDDFPHDDSGSHADSHTDAYDPQEEDEHNDSHSDVPGHTDTEHVDYEHHDSFMTHHTDLHDDTTC